MESSETRFIVPLEIHDAMVREAFMSRGYTESEAGDWTRICAEAARHGVQSHNAIKALHLDELFGSQKGGCIPGATTEPVTSNFDATQVWNANRKSGPTVAFEAIETCIELANKFGVGIVAVNNAFHYLWGGGYVLEVARRGYIGYTCCTALLAEVVPYGGRSPTLGTNPHSWAFPTTDSIGFPVLVDWATSKMAMGKVQALKRAGIKLPPGVAIDDSGEETTDPAKVHALLTFGAHKGYGLSLVDELFAAYIGGALPTMRGRFADDEEKHSTCFYFQVIHPEAICGGPKHTTKERVKAIVDDILGHGNDQCLLPGQLESQAASKCIKVKGLLFNEKEVEELNKIAAECNARAWGAADFAVFESESS